MIEILERIITNNFLILVILVLGYFGRESIKNFFSDKILEKQREYNEKRDAKQQAFHRELSKQNAYFHKEFQEALEKQRVEFQKELQNIDYKNDYYKKIIDKRMESYEKLNDVVNSIMVIRQVLSKDCVKQGYSVCELFIDVKNIDDMLDKVVDIRRYSIWFTEEIVEKISYINLILSNVSLALNHPSDEILAKYNLSVKDIGVKKCSILIGKFESEKLCRLAEEIKLIIANDLLEMHNVEDFLSNKVNEGE